MYALLKKNATFFIPYILFLLAGTVWLCLSNRIDVSLFINGHNSPVADLFFTYWTNIGLGYLIIPVLLLLAFVRFRYVIMAVVAYLLAFGINDGIKFAVGSPRPEMVFEQSGQAFYHVPGVELYDWNSFPSGHTAISFSMFCLLALMVNKPSLKCICFLAALLVGYSRIYLAEHFITDVIGGSIIGTGCAVFSFMALSNWQTLNKFAHIDNPLIRL